MIVFTFRIPSHVATYRTPSSLSPSIFASSSRFMSWRRALRWERRLVPGLPRPVLPRRRRSSRSPARSSEDCHMIVSLTAHRGERRKRKIWQSLGMIRGSWSVFKRLHRRVQTHCDRQSRHFPYHSLNPTNMESSLPGSCGDTNRSAAHMKWRQYFPSRVTREVYAR